jgi:uncharacterized repeat protein (TIGR01451 family)
LATLSKATDARDPNINLKVLLGNNPVLEGTFTQLSDPTLSYSVPIQEIDETGELKGDIVGDGKLWYSSSLTYAYETPDLSSTNTNGLILTRSFEAVEPKGRTKGSSVFKRGDVVKVTITLLSTTDRSNLVVTDRIPSGFEPISFALKDAPLELLRTISQNDSDNEDIAFSLFNFWNWYDLEEVNPDNITLFANHLPKGVYTYNYLVRPITPGTYITPGPTAEEMYAPENYGRALGETITVEK